MMKSEKINTFFSQGKFKELGEAFDDLGPRRASALEERVSLVGGLVLLGRFEDALQIFDLFKAKAKSEEKIACLIYLGIGNVRRSNYPEARKMFVQGMLEHRRLKKSQSKAWLKSAFYAWFGFAFFHHFRAHWGRGMAQAEKALGFAEQADFLFGSLLSHDLLAHLYFHEGEIHQSLKSFKHSQAVAKKLKNEGVMKSSRIAEVIYRCQVLQLPEDEKPEEKIRKAIDLLDADDSYSRSNLILELSRHLIMAGKMSEATKALNDAYENIFTYRHKRQTSEINLRFSYSLWWQGHGREALSLLRSSEASLDPSIDSVQLLQVHGLQRAIWASMGRITPPSKVENNFHERNLQNFMNKRIESRLPDSKPFIFSQGEDLLGDLINSLHAKSEEGFKKCLELERFGLLSIFFEANPGESLLVCDRKRSLCISLHKGDVSVGKIRWSENLLKIVEELSQKTLTKAELIEKCFGYSYQPERHDPLLYASLSRLRKALGENQHLLELKEHGYQLQGSLKVKFYPSLEQVPRHSNEKDSSIPSKGSETGFETIELSINSRQLLLIKDLSARPDIFIGARDYSKKYEVSLTTAFRDLDELFEKKILSRLGKARATRYCLSAHASLKTLEKGKL